MRPVILIVLLALAGCASTAGDEQAEVEQAGVVERMGQTLRYACGANNECLVRAARFAGFLWQYRENIAIQTRVYRCAGQYALRQGYRRSVGQFVSEIDDDEKASGLMAYMYECAVPQWARSFFDSDAATAAAEPALRAAPAPGASPVGSPAGRTTPAAGTSDPVRPVQGPMRPASPEVPRQPSGRIP